LRFRTPLSLLWALSSVDAATCPRLLQPAFALYKMPQSHNTGALGGRGTRYCGTRTRRKPDESFSTSNFDDLFFIFTVTLLLARSCSRAGIPSNPLTIPSTPPSPLSGFAPTTSLITNCSKPQSHAPIALFSPNRCNLDSISFDDMFKLHAPTLRSVPARFIQDSGNILMNELSNVVQYRESY
jgi:hypothetical protein